MASIARKHGVNAGQVLIKWALQSRPGSSVLPKSVAPARIRANAEMQGWALSPQEVASLSAMPTQQRMVHGQMWLSKDGPYRTMAELWDEPDDQDAAARDGRCC